MVDHELRHDSDAGSTVGPATVAQHGPPSEVRFVRVSAAEPRVRCASIPDAYRNHPLIRNRFFYTVPERLLQLVCRPQNGESFEVDETLLQMELDLSRICGDHESRVGFWKGVPILCGLMHWTPLCREDLEYLDSLSDDQIDDTLNDLSKPLLSFSEIACGYAGWLTTNPDYLSELDALLLEFGHQMHRWGTAMVGLPIPSSQPDGFFNPTGEAGWKEYDAAVLEFCLRWRLRGLAGPRIPIPMQPMMAGSFPLSIIEQLMRAGGVFNWPDTFPLLARDELRHLMANVLQSSGSSEHLAGWRRIISLDNKAKNQIGALERHFQFQHFWRLLRERHPTAFERRLNRVERAFSQYFGVDETSIQLDRRKIRKRLGAAWDRSP